MITKEQKQKLIELIDKRTRQIYQVLIMEKVGEEEYHKAIEEFGAADLEMYNYLNELTVNDGTT